MSFTNQSGYDAVNETFEKLFQELVTNGPEGRWKQFTHVKPLAGNVLKYGGLTGLPGAEEWSGNAKRTPLRYSDISFASEAYQASIPIDLVDIAGDKEGMVADVIAGQLRRFRDGQLGWEKLLVEKLWDGTSENSEDGTTHFATDHPGSGGSSQINLDTGIVSAASIRTGIQRMSAYSDRDTGIPFGGRCTHILHGPNQRIAVDEVINAQLLTGTAGTNVVSSYGIVPVEVPMFIMENPNYLVLVDASDPMHMPMGLGLAQDWQSRELPTDLPRREFQAYAVGALARGHWSKSYLITNGE